MTIERVTDANNKLSILRLVPGYMEMLAPPYIRGILGTFVGWDQVDLEVIADDEIEITFHKRNEYGRLVGDERKHRLRKHEVNLHTIESQRTRPGKRVYFRWTPSSLNVDPQTEESIQRLVSNGTWTPEQADAMRDQLIFEKSQQAPYKP